MLYLSEIEYTKRILSEAKNYAEHALLSQISDRCIIEAEESLNRSNFSTKRFVRGLLLFRHYSILIVIMFLLQKLCTKTKME